MPVRSMTTNAIAVASDPPSQFSSANGVADRSWKSLEMIMPVSAEKKCPPITARGCARGLAGRP